ncbi:MAG: hypothetical protein PHX87_02900 [Candidatus Peribacteraceae bacterium]|nr:hypothetical protein [Candidatus Peribacteraceae bacterium]MDD5742357.1 hypothetical protein [Candidatus Peribacteraceae bacterium]
MTQKTCFQCSAPFEITQDDKAFYREAGLTVASKHFSIPEPVTCPACRMQRRIAHRNFFNLCHRTSSLSDKRIISMYDEDVPFPVYEIHEWWSDRWDGLRYGREVDFGRPFFDQLGELFNVVPRMSIFNNNCENTDYCNFSFQSRNCYLIGGNVGNEDCCYGHIVWLSKNCYDCLYIYRCERCYECVDCVQCYELAFSHGCDNCSNGTLLVHCSGCKDCIGCVGLKNKQYCVFNQPFSREDYERKMQEFDRGSHVMIELARKRLADLTRKEVVRHYHGVNCEDVTGDYLYNCKGVHDSYDAKNCEDCRFLATAESFVHSYDSNYCPSTCEWSYQCVACNGSSLFCCHNTMYSAETAYCQDCSSCKNCFGCASLKSKQYCIFNRQYTRQEYEELVPRVIEHMQQTGEWGQFFPITMSPFGYNQTMAQEYFPLTEEKVEKRGWRWVVQKSTADEYLGPRVAVSDRIQDVPDDITQKILLCSASKQPYKIIPQELEFCRSMTLPLHTECFAERHRRRMRLKNPRHLWSRTCAKCGKGIETTYAPERPEIVYCESCYLSSVY